jgi:hypothetical protein
MTGRLPQAAAQFVQRDDSAFGVAVKHIKDASLSYLAVQGHLDHVECDFLQRGRVSVDRAKESLPGVCLFVPEKEIE